MTSRSPRTIDVSRQRIGKSNRLITHFNLMVDDSTFHRLCPRARRATLDSRQMYNTRLSLRVECHRLTHVGIINSPDSLTGDELDPWLQSIGLYQKAKVQRLNRAENKEYYKDFKALCKTVAQRADLVVSTPAQLNGPVLDDMKFKTAVIDEATKVDDGDFAMTRSKAENLIMIGDKNQLAQVLMSTKEQNPLLMHFERSAYERYLLAGWRSHQLKESMRFVKGQVDLPFDIFYAKDVEIADRPTASKVVNYLQAKHPGQLKAPTEKGLHPVLLNVEGNCQ